MALQSCVRRLRIPASTENADTDSQFIAFADRSPGASVHLLVIPRVHTLNIRALGARDVPMLEAMQALGIRLLSVHGIALAKQRLGFHIARASQVQEMRD